MRVELTTEIVEVIKFCKNSDDNFCDKCCPLAGACLEYYTGDKNENKKIK